MLKVAELFSLEAFWCSSRVRSLADFFSFEVSHQKSESCWGGGGGEGGLWEKRNLSRLLHVVKKPHCGIVKAALFPCCSGSS